MSKLECTKDKKPWYRWLWMGTMCAVMTAVTAASVYLPRENAAEAEEAPRRRARVTAYVQDGRDLRLSDALAENVDQVNYAFALLTDGKADGSHWRGIDEVKRFLKKHPQVDGVLSVGGWGADGFSDAASTAEGRERLAESILTLMDAHGFVGVDMDWEYPGTGAGGTAWREEDWENYYALLTLLREGLDARQAALGRDFLLSVALGASDTLIAQVDGERLASLVDQVNVMTYDMTGFERITGHHAALSPQEDSTQGAAHALQACIAQGIPEAKLNLGAACYGRAWRNVLNVGNGLHARAETSGNKIYTYDQLAELLAREETTRYWDETAQAAWLFDGSTFISYEDAASMGAKAAYALENNLLGVAVWSAEQDSSVTLLSALGNALTESASELDKSGDS